MHFAHGSKIHGIFGDGVGLATGVETQRKEFGTGRWWQGNSYEMRMIRRPNPGSMYRLEITLASRCPRDFPAGSSYISTGRPKLQKANRRYLQAR